uniref:Uncharacterized protein n=1 Tax=Oryza brachyantha TaxID=4533 RepID=J3N487_ORYBR
MVTYQDLCALALTNGQIHARTTSQPRQSTPIVQIAFNFQGKLGESAGEEGRGGVGGGGVREEGEGGDAAPGVPRREVEGGEVGVGDPGAPEGQQDMARHDGVVDEDDVLEMPRLMVSMAEALMISPPPVLGPAAAALEEAPDGGMDEGGCVSLWDHS